MSHHNSNNADNGYYQGYQSGGPDDGHYLDNNSAGQQTHRFTQGQEGQYSSHSTYGDNTLLPRPHPLVVRSTHDFGPPSSLESYKIPTKTKATSGDTSTRLAPILIDPNSTGYDTDQAGPAHSPQPPPSCHRDHHLYHHHHLPSSVTLPVDSSLDASNSSQGVLQGRESIQTKPSNRSRNPKKVDPELKHVFVYDSVQRRHIIAKNNTQGAKATSTSESSLRRHFEKLDSRDTDDRFRLTWYGSKRYGVRKLRRRDLVALGFEREDLNKWKEGESTIAVMSLLAGSDTELEDK